MILGQWEDPDSFERRSFSVVGIPPGGNDTGARHCSLVIQLLERTSVVAGAGELPGCTGGGICKNSRPCATMTGADRSLNVVHIGGTSSLGNLTFMRASS